MDKAQVIALAGKAGFGGNQRNTLLVKLIAFVKLVEREEREACALAFDRYRDAPNPYLSAGNAEFVQAVIRMRSNVELRGRTQAQLEDGPSRTQGSVAPSHDD